MFSLNLKYVLLNVAKRLTSVKIGFQDYQLVVVWWINETGRVMKKVFKTSQIHTPAQSW